VYTDLLLQKFFLDDQLVTVANLAWSLPTARREPIDNLRPVRMVDRPGNGNRDQGRSRTRLPVRAALFVGVETSTKPNSKPKSDRTLVVARGPSLHYADVPGGNADLDAAVVAW